MLNRPAHFFGVFAATVGIFSNSFLIAAPAGFLPQTTDITLNRDSMLIGRIVDPRGQAVANADITLLDNNEIVSLVKSDLEGNFRVPNIRPGTYRLASHNVTQICRIWAPGTAPPAAKQSALLVRNNPVAAGQVAPLKYWLANPTVMLGLAAIVIAVPIVAFNVSKDREIPGS